MRHNNSCHRIDCHSISKLISMVIWFTYYIPCSKLKALDSHKLCMVCQLQHQCNTRVYKDNQWSILIINSNCVLDPMEDITLTIMGNIIHQVVKSFCRMLSQYSSLAISHTGMTVLDPHSKWLIRTLLSSEDLSSRTFLEISIASLSRFMNKMINRFRVSKDHLWPQAKAPPVRVHSVAYTTTVPAS